MPLKVTTIGSGTDTAGAARPIGATPATSFQSTLVRVSAAPSLTKSQLPQVAGADVIQSAIDRSQGVDPATAMKPVFQNLLQGSHVSGAASLPDEEPEAFGESDEDE